MKSLNQRYKEKTQDFFYDRAQLLLAYQSLKSAVKKYRQTKEELRLLEQEIEQKQKKSKNLRK